jgi:hypothetical protein
VRQDHFVDAFHVAGGQRDEWLETGASPVTCLERNDYAHRIVSSLPVRERIGGTPGAGKAGRKVDELQKSSSPCHGAGNCRIRMVELLRSNDLVLISYVLHLLESAGVTAHVFDEHTSAVEGSIGALPRRIMVDEDDLPRSRRILGNVALTIAE